ncbi:MAG: intracellular septation protein involved in cell division [uncultured bacterium]|nr:MAG: intracellular septation protein involved in cell division [uncultured bacterium]
MKLLFNFLPILLFFIGYKFYGIYTATIVAMVASLLQVGFFWFKHRRVELTHTITLILILVLGTATLLSHNTLFIKWKPTAIYWVFSLLFLGSQIIGDKTFIQRLMDNKITLPQNVWQRLNLSWAIFFGLMGAVNIYIAYKFSTDIWVNFKLFGTLGSTVVFGILQSLYMAKHLKQQPQEE